MVVGNWMSKDVASVAPEDTVPYAITLMREKDIRHLPVVEDERVVGILSDRVIKDYLPSEATSLDIFEINYLLGQLKIRRIMRTPVFTATADTPIEEAALLLYEHRVSCLPVLEQDRLVGIITDKDVYAALIAITGVRQGGHRLGLQLEDIPGSIREAADLVRRHGFGVESILSSHAFTAPGRRQVVIRTRGPGDFASLREDLLKHYPDADIRRAAVA